MQVLPLLAGFPAVQVFGAGTAADPLSQLLQRQARSRAHDYRGRFRLQQGAVTLHARIVHASTASGRVEKLSFEDPPAHEYVRRGGEVWHYLPTERRLIVESSLVREGFPDVRDIDPLLITRHYRQRKLGAMTIAGHAVEGIALQPNDRLRYEYRFWLDTRHGLLLRSQVLDENQRLIEQLTFTELIIGKQLSSAVRPTYADTRGWHLEKAMTEPLARASFQALRVPTGFESRGAFRRILREVGDQRQAVSRAVEQLVFSDGLANLSVFIEPWPHAQKAQWAGRGAVNMVGKRHQNFWLTIVGEVPMETIRVIADSLDIAA